MEFMNTRGWSDNKWGGSAFTYCRYNGGVYRTVIYVFIDEYVFVLKK